MAEDKKDNVPPFEMVMSGIKCDTEGCGFFDKDVPFESYSSYVNKPCPDCGGNLLTQEDFEAANQLMDLGNLMKGIADLMYPDGVPNDEMSFVSGEITSDTKGGLGIDFKCENEEDEEE